MSTKAQLETDLVADFKWFCYRGWQVKFSPRRYRRYAAERQFRQVARRLPPGAVALDCGANIGDVTDVLARRGLTVHAFEPDARCADALRSRFLDHARVVIHQCAVDAKAGKANLFRVGAAADADIGKTVSSSLVQQEFHDSEATHYVEVVDLLDFAASLDTRPAMTKMDIEGAEVGVLERLLDSSDPELLGEVFVETHEKYMPHLRERTQALRERVEKDNLRYIHLNWF